MKNKRLLNLIGQIDDAFIEEAAEAKKLQKLPWLKWCAVAACMMVLLSTGTVFLHNDLQSDPLPMLTIKEMQGDMAGFEGYFAYSIDELTNSNPWTEDCALRVLPVYRNSLFRYTQDWVVTNPDTEQMKKAFMDAARRLGMETNQMEINEHRSDGTTIDSMDTENTEYKIEVNAWMCVNIQFKQKNILPDGYSISTYDSYNRLNQTAQYLLRKYEKFIDMEDPCIDISLGDYDVDGNQTWGVSFFENSDTPTEAILNYNFNRIYFYGDDNGQLSAAFYQYTDLTDNLGNYPIINADKALEYLCSGNYISSVPEKFPGREAVKKVELVYCNATNDEIFMPYYKFYVQTDSTDITTENKKSIASAHIMSPLLQKNI